MRRHFKKTRIYHAPSAKVTQMALENNFCQTIRLNMQVDELRNINAEKDSNGNPVEPLYFEF